MFERAAKILEVSRAMFIYGAAKTVAERVTNKRKGAK